jgi:acetoin utilization protein AcuB
MSTDVKSVAPDTSAEVAWTMMTTHGIHHLVVIKDGRVAGVLSNRDAGGRAGAAVRRHCAAADLMSEPAIAAAPSTTVRKAANLMRGRSIGCLVVVEAGRLCGPTTAAGS